MVSQSDLNIGGSIDTVINDTPFNPLNVSRASAYSSMITSASLLKVSGPQIWMVLLIFYSLWRTICIKFILKRSSPVSAQYHTLHLTYIIVYNIFRCLNSDNYTPIL